MKVSIITVAYNSQSTIEETIQSVLSQDYSAIEYIVIDGGSSDGTVDLIKKYQANIDYFVSEPDQGIYDAMNKGVDAATGELIGILNSDDVYANNKVISDLVNQVKGHDAVYGDLVYVKANDLNKIKRVWKSGNYKTGSFFKGWMPSHPTFFVKKACYTNFGSYDTRLKSAADYELMLRFILKNNISISYLPKVVVKMRLGGVSNVSFKNRYLANREDKLAWKLNGLRPGFATFLLKPLRKITQFRI